MKEKGCEKMGNRLCMIELSKWNLIEQSLEQYGIQDLSELAISRNTVYSKGKSIHLTITCPIRGLRLVIHSQTIWHSHRNQANTQIWNIENLLNNSYGVTREQMRSKCIESEKILHILFHDKIFHQLSVIACPPKTRVKNQMIILTKAVFREASIEETVSYQV